MVVVVDRRLCLHCGGCVATCPVKASVFQDPDVIIDEGLCCDCGACVAVCPMGALSLR